MNYDLNLIFKLSKNEKCGKILGIISMILGTLALFTVFVFGDRYFNDILYIGVLILGLWFWTYGFMAFISMRSLWSLFYPTVSIVIIASLPCIVAALTFRYKEWIEILSVSLSSIVTLIIFAVFMYYSVTKSMKAKQKYIKDNIKNFDKKSMIKRYNDNSISISIIENLNGDRASIISKNGLCQYVVIEKNINNNLELIEKKRFVEMYSAQYYAIKSLCEFSNKV